MRYLPFFLLLLLAAGCNSEQKEAEALLARKWKYDLDAIRQVMAENGSDFNRINLMEMVMGRLQDAEIDLQPDGSMVFKLPGNTSYGSWSVNKEGTELRLDLVGTAQPYHIAELTENRCVLVPTDDDIMLFTRVMVPADSSSTEN